MKNLKLKCEYMTDNKANEVVTYIEGTQLAGEKFEEMRRVEFDLKALPIEMEKLCTAYGLRAILADRTSDAKKLGINKLDWMQEVFDMLATGQWNKARTVGGGIDRALVHLITTLKGCTAIEAEAALKHAGKEAREALAAKYADQLEAVREELATAESVDLTDL